MMRARPTLSSDPIDRGRPRLRRAWRPTSISGCKLWLLADHCTLTSGAVSSWDDQSGLGNHFTQGTAGSRPVQATDGGATAIQFDNTDDVLTCTSFSTGGPVSAFSIYVVLRLIDESAAHSWGRFDGFLDYYSFSDGIIYDGFCSNARKTTVNPTPALTTRRIMSIKSVASSWKLALDGTDIYTTGTNTFSSPNGVSCQLGKAGAQMNGYMYEAVGYGKILASNEETTLINYLKTKFSIA